MDSRFFNKSKLGLFKSSIDEENDNLIIDLESKVHTLKDISHSMRDEINQSRFHINDLNNSFDDVRSVLGRTLLNMKKILKVKSRSDTMVKMVIIFLTIIIIMYIMYSFK